MRRRLNPWVVVLTAALTFGSLMAFVGPRSFGHHRGYWGHRHGYYHGYGHDRDGAYDGEGPHNRRLAPRPDSADSQ